MDNIKKVTAEQRLRGWKHLDIEERRTASAKCQRVCDIEQEHQGDWIRGTRKE